MPGIEPLRIRLRPGTPEDREYLWLLHRDTMRDYVDKTWGWDETWQRAKFDEDFDPLSFSIIQKDGDAVGYMAVRRSRDEIFLAAIEIEPKQQNQGVATQLITELFEESDASRLPMTLRVLKVNPARRLYERLRFRCAGETSMHYLMKREPRPS